MSCSHLFMQAGKTLSARRWQAAFSPEGRLDIASVLSRIQRGVSQQAQLLRLSHVMKFLHPTMEINRCEEAFPCNMKRKKIKRSITGRSTCLNLTTLSLSLECLLESLGHYGYLILLFQFFCLTRVFILQ